MRASGRVPAILYGHKLEPMSLSLNEADIRTIMHHNPDSTVVDLMVPGGEEVNTIIRDVQRHPASGKLLHVDFQRISLDEKIRVEVHLDLIGDPVGVKDQGGILEYGTRSLNVMCLPTAIPEAIELDVTQLNIGDSIPLGDVISRYPDLEFLDDLESTTLATVVPPKIEEEPEAVEEGEEMAEPEVVGKEEEKEAEEEPKEE